MTNNTVVENYKSRVLSGESLSKEDALKLMESPLEELATAANEIREHFCGNKFDICTIINAKSGKCSENCKFCAQSSFYKTKVEVFPFLSPEKITEKAKKDSSRGVLLFSLVTSGRALSDKEVDEACMAIRDINKNCNVRVCVSMGLLSEEQYKKLKAAGASRVHNNLEASKNFFPSVCTTHTTEDKIGAINNAKAAGLSVCSGGIIGLGETPSDRIDLALSVRKLGVKSMPINVLNPIPGTPFEHNKKISEDELCRTIAVFRFLLPDCALRLAGGRGLYKDHGRKCFLSGANAMISGDMLTTSGYTVESDIKLIKELGFTPCLLDD